MWQCKSSSNLVLPPAGYLRNRLKASIPVSLSIMFFFYIQIVCNMKTKWEAELFMLIFQKKIISIQSNSLLNNCCNVTSIFTLQNNYYFNPNPKFHSHFSYNRFPLKGTIRVEIKHSIVTIVFRKIEKKQEHGVMMHFEYSVNE